VVASNLLAPGDVLAAPGDITTWSTSSAFTSRPVDIEFDGSGGAWVLSQQSSQLGKLDPATGTISPVYNLGYDNTFDFAIDSAGAMFVLHVSNTPPFPLTVGKVLPDGTTTSSAPIATPGFAEGLIIGPDGKVWVGADDALHRLDPVTFADNPLPVTGLYGMVVGPDGNVWGVAFGAAKVWKITPAGVVSTIDVPAMTAGSGDITVGPDGALWFVERNSATGHYYRLATDGTTATQFAILGTNPQPTWIATGVDGHLWIGNEGTSTLLAVDPSTGAIVQTLDSKVNSPVNLHAGPGGIWYGGLISNEVARLELAAPPPAPPPTSTVPAAAQPAPADETPAAAAVSAAPTFTG
jgi:virginiamycin B lyase